MKPVSKRLATLSVAAALMGAVAQADAAFATPQETPTGALPFTNWTRTDTDTTYQQWRGPVNGGAPALLGGDENFTTLFGLNQPDNDYYNPNGIATAQYLDEDRNSTEITSGFLIGGSRNVYSFGASADWEVLTPDYGYGLNIPTTVILQVEVAGNELLVGPSTPGYPTAPNSVRLDGVDWVDHVELSRVGAGGGGFEVTHWFRFELASNEFGHVLEFDTYDPSLGEFDELLYGHMSTVAIAVDTFVPNYVYIPEGDLDADGFVGITDLNVVLSHWNQTVTPGDSNGDPTLDGFVGIEDLNVVLSNWNKGTPPGTAVPEPGTLMILGLPALALLRRAHD